jgi:hypothetical protein
MKVIPYINNTIINDPNNLAELSIDITFDNTENVQELSITSWEIGVGASGNDGALLANNHILSGLTTGVGALEGQPFQLDLEKAGQIIRLFDGYLDLSDAEISCNRVTAPAIEDKSLEWLTEVFDSVTAEFLYFDRKITDDDFISIPYVINSIPKTGESFMMLLTAFIVTDTIKREIQALKDMSVETTNPISAIGGVLKIALRVLYIATLLLTIVKLILDAVRLIIQPVKYHKAMYVRDTCRIFAAYYGLQFKSSILDDPTWSKEVILPPSYGLPEDNDGLFGFLKPSSEQRGLFNGTFGDLLRILIEKFNAKILVVDGVLYLEREDFTLSNDIYELPPVEVEEYRLNADEFVSNYYISFLTDLNDKNTIQQYNGTSFQSFTSPLKIVNSGMVLTKGFAKRNIPLALGKEKTELTATEKILKAYATVLDPIVGALIKLVNGIINIVNAIIKAIKKIIDAINKLPGVNIKFDPKPIKAIKWTPLKDLIENRIGMLMLENDFVDTAKFLIIDKKSDARYTKLAPQNRTHLTGKYLFDNFHFTNSFDPAIYPLTKQHKLYRTEEVPFCFDDYLKVRRSNFMRFNGQNGRIDKISWNVNKQTANIDFRINEIWTRNLITKNLTSKMGNSFN